LAVAVVVSGIGTSCGPIWRNADAAAGCAT
jgi:hypothetical protein